MYPSEKYEHEKKEFKISKPSSQNEKKAKNTVVNPELFIVSKWVRLTNWVIDFISIYILAYFLGYVAVNYGYTELFLNSNEYVLGFIIMGIYYISFEFVSGKTIGKFLTKTKVVNKFGEKPDLLNIIGRTLCRAIPFESFSFLIKDRGWHDSVSETFVIQESTVQDEKTDLILLFKKWKRKWQINENDIEEVHFLLEKYILFDKNYANNIDSFYIEFGFDLISEIKSITSSFSLIKALLDPLIEKRIVDSKYPHEIIIKPEYMDFEKEFELNA